MGKSLYGLHSLVLFLVSTDQDHTELAIWFGGKLVEKSRNANENKASVFIRSSVVPFYLDIFWLQYSENLISTFLHQFQDNKHKYIVV